MKPTHENVCLLPLAVKTLPILRDGKPEVLDLEAERRTSRAVRGQRLYDHPSPIPDPWEGRK